jgi:hypothetical protein
VTGARGAECVRPRGVRADSTGPLAARPVARVRASVSGFGTNFGVPTAGRVGPPAPPSCQGWPRTSCWEGGPTHDVRSAQLCDEGSHVMRVRTKRPGTLRPPRRPGPQRMNGARPSSAALTPGSLTERTSAQQPSPVYRCSRLTDVAGRRPARSSARHWAETAMIHRRGRGKIVDGYCTGTRVRESWGAAVVDAVPGGRTGM